MGLSVDFTLRDQLTGRVLEPDRITEIVHNAIDKLLKEKPEAKQYLFLDYLFQPSKSQQLDQNKPGKISEDELLSLVQVSLRPMAKQHFRYWIHRISGRADFNQPMGGEPVTKNVTIKLPPQTPFDFIEATRNDAQIFAIPEQSADSTYQTPIQIPASGEAILLFHSTSQVAPKINDVEAISLDLTNAYSLNFDVPLASWVRKFQSAPNESDVTLAWQRFSCYLLRLGSRFGAINQTTIDLPEFKETQKIAGILDWLNRFFEAGAEIVTTENGLSVTGREVNFACAYPRVTSPMAVTTDEAKRITYFHRIDDRLGHVYRYYVLPEFRYDRLWEILAGSDTLFPDLKPALSLFTLPEKNERGLDVVIDRIQEVAAPLVLFSGRLDEQTDQAKPAKPGRITEIIVAKHPDQLISQRNRTNTRLYDFQGISIGTLRRFAFGKELAKLNLEAELGINPHPIPPTASIELPGPLSKPSELNLTNLASLSGQEVLSLDLPTRIGEFGKGATVIQVPSLPFYYEHLFLLVAQTSTLVSPVTTVIQREFDYESPTPSATYEADGPVTGQRVLQIGIELKSFWDSLSEEAKAQWPSENPDNSLPDPDLTYAALPDTGVVYQVSLTDTVGNVEAQTEFFFDLANQTGQPYQVRKLGSVLTGKLRNIVAVKPKPKVFALQTEFAKANALTFPQTIYLSNDVIIPPNTPVLLPQGDFTLQSYREQLLRLFPDLQVLTGPDVSPEELTFMLREYTAIIPDRKSFDNLLIRARGKVRRLQKGDQRFFIATVPLNREERESLKLAGLPAADLAAIVAFCEQIENRQVVEAFFSGWFTEVPISSRHQFGPASDRLEFPAPMSCILTLTVNVADRESVLADLRQLLNQPLDNSFANAIRMLIEQMISADTNQTLFTSEACVGLEQIREIAPDGIVSIDAINRQLVWKGKITEPQQQVLNRWGATQNARLNGTLSDFGATISALLLAAKRLSLTIPFEVKNSDATEIPDILSNRMRVNQEPDTPGKVTWFGLTVSFEEERALTKYIEAIQTPELKAALETLRQQLADQTISTPILESDWKPRPQQRDLTGTLQNHLLIGNGLIRFWGWMTSTEGDDLLIGQLPVDQQAIRQLYKRSMSSGLTDSTLQVIASRGTAERKMAPIYLTPLTQ